MSDVDIIVLEWTPRGWAAWIVREFEDGRRESMTGAYHGATAEEALAQLVPAPRDYEGRYCFEWRRRTS